MTADRTLLGELFRGGHLAPPAPAAKSALPVPPGDLVRPGADPEFLSLKLSKRAPSIYPTLRTDVEDGPCRAAAGEGSCGADVLLGGLTRAFAVGRQEKGIKPPSAVPADIDRFLRQTERETVGKVWTSSRVA